MLIATWPAQYSMYLHNYSCAVPSPLAPRSINVPPNSRSMSSKPHEDKGSVVASAPHAPFAHRAIKKAPGQSRDELKDKRRRVYLRKVEAGREDSRFERRADDILRLDFVHRKRQWEAEKARSAPTLDEELFEDEDEDEDEDITEAPASYTDHQPFASSSSVSASATTSLSTEDVQPAIEVEEVELDEMEDLEALLSLLPDESDSLTRRISPYTPYRTSDQASEYFGSDDDDFEAFLGRLDEERPAGPETDAQPHPSCDAMDTS